MLASENKIKRLHISQTLPGVSHNVVQWSGKYFQSNFSMSYQKWYDNKVANALSRVSFKNTDDEVAFTKLMTTYTG